VVSAPFIPVMLPVTPPLDDTNVLIFEKVCVVFVGVVPRVVVDFAVVVITELLVGVVFVSLRGVVVDDALRNVVVVVALRGVVVVVLAKVVVILGTDVIAIDLTMVVGFVIIVGFDGLETDPDDSTINSLVDMIRPVELIVFIDDGEPVVA